MSEMGLQELVRFLTLYLAAGVEVGAAVIVGFAAAEAIMRAAAVSSSARLKRITPSKSTSGLLAGSRWQLNLSWRRTSSAR